MKFVFTFAYYVFVLYTNSFTQILFVFSILWFFYFLKINFNTFIKKNYIYIYIYAMHVYC
jgi:hypothetical protein